MEPGTKSNLANILYSNMPSLKKPEKSKHYIKDELDEPKHKIADPILFARTREVLGNLISKRMKTTGGTDIDWLIEHNGGFMIFELKIFHDDRISISKAQMLSYEKLHENLPKCHVLFIGHDDIDFSDPNDPIWIFEMQEWKSGKIPRSPSRPFDLGNDQESPDGYRIERDFMMKSDVKDLRDRIDSIWQEFER